MRAVRGFVDVVRRNVELAIGLVKQMVVACPRPIAVAVDEHDIKGEEPECRVQLTVPA
jgi:hypothetical protein